MSKSRETADIIETVVDVAAVAAADATTKANAALASANAYTDTGIANLISSAPATLDTLNELAAALGDDANFATTVTNSIATKASITYVDNSIAAIPATDLTGLASETYVNNAVAGFDALPTQTGNDGKFLTTDGSTSSWSNAGASVDAIYENSDTISLNWTIASNRRGMSTGPINIANGVSVTVESGSRWVVL